MWSNVKERRLTGRVAALQDRLSLAQSNSSKREEGLQAQLKKTTEEAAAEIDTFRREGCAREEALRLKLEQLTIEHKRVKEVMVRRRCEDEQAVTPLKQKSRQFVSRNIELSARNRQLQETLKELTVQYNREKEEQEKSSKGEKVRRQSSEEERRVVRPRGGEHLDGERSSSSRSLRSRTRERRRSYAGHHRGGREVPEEDAKHYQEVYSHLQREFTELQRSHQLLQTRLQQASSPTSSCDSQREEKNLAALRNKLTAAETKAP